jgi:anti-sigma factor ChrR (cupin superfamily)
MCIRADFSRPEVVTPDQHQWTASPQPGVERVMLDRIGAEKARATSLVRYAPASRFPAHPHPGGEEILVLEGTFSDGDGHFGAGWYLRNPPGSSHQPYRNEGALIFVKLWQMQSTESRFIRIDTRDPSTWQRGEERDVCPLFSDGTEQVAMQRLAPGTPVFTQTVNSAELLVVDGELRFDGQRCARGSWIRLPAGASWPGVVAGEGGAMLFLKTGHLAGMTAGK